LVIDFKNKSLFKKILLLIRPSIAFIFCILAIYASGATTVLYGFILIMCGIPVYAYIMRKNTI
ncbi:MAG: amino acid permease, partial [Clostridium sp.]